MTAVECSHPHCERDVVALLTRIELKCLGCDLTSSEAPRRNQLGELDDRICGAIDGENVAARADALRDLACCGSGTAADLDHPDTGAER